MIVYENVAFHNTNEVALTRSKWLSTFVRAGIAAHTVDQLYASPSKQHFKSIIAGLKAEIVALQDGKVNFVGSYIDLHAIQRSLIPTVGKGLNI